MGRRRDRCVEEPISVEDVTSTGPQCSISARTAFSTHASSGAPGLERGARSTRGCTRRATGRAGGAPHVGDAEQVTGAGVRAAVRHDVVFDGVSLPRFQSCGEASRPGLDGANAASAAASASRRSLIDTGAQQRDGAWRRTTRSRRPRRERATRRLWLREDRSEGTVQCRRSRPE